MYLFSALELTHGAYERIACVSLRLCVGFGIQAESVQDARQEADIVMDLYTVSKLQQSRQVPQA